MKMIGKFSIAFLALTVALSTVAPVQGSRLKQMRRSIENAEEPSNSEKETAFRRRRLTMADDVFTTTTKDFQVVGYHRALGEAVTTALHNALRRIRALFRFTNSQWRKAMNVGIGWFIQLLQTLQSKNEALIEQEETPIVFEPSSIPTVASLYGSIATAISGDSKETPTDDATNIRTPTRKQHSSDSIPSNPKVTVQKSAPLRNHQGLPKKHTTSLRKQQPLKTSQTKQMVFNSDPSSSFYSLNAGAMALTSQEDGAEQDESQENILAPSTSLLVGLLPTLVAGLVFTTAGSMIGYLWEGDWSASSVFNYFWGDSEAEHDGMAMSTESTEVGSDAFPVTPDR